MSASSHPARKLVMRWGLLCILAGAQGVWACSRPPPPPLRQQFADTPRVYVARLKAFKTLPWAGVPTGAIEDGTFEVLMTLKGPTPKDGELKTHTEYSGGNCTLSILNPVEVFDSTGRAVSNP